MNFSIDVQNEVIKIKILLTHLTGKDSPELRQLIDDKLQAGYNKFVVDLSLVVFMDSTFLGSLVSALKKISGIGGKLILASVTDEVRSIIENTGTSNIFSVCEDVDAAIKLT